MFQTEAQPPKVLTELQPHRFVLYLRCSEILISGYYYWPVLKVTLSLAPLRVRFAGLPGERKALT